MKILNYKELNKGNITASFDVVIEEWGITIKRCGLFLSKDKRFIGFPSYKYDDAEGKVKYAPYVFMEKTRKERFDKSVIALLDAGTFERADAPKIEERKFDEECPF
jgi:hypothetical protein